MTVLATIVLLGVLIFVHELGHFLAAKMVGVEVQRFSIGLGPKVWGLQKGETEYVLSAIPLGGYVKMGGMADEVLEHLEGGRVMGARQPSARDFDAKPLWARAFVISAGVIMNMLFALVTYTVVAGAWGVRYPATDRIGTVEEDLLPSGTEALGRVPARSRVLRIGERQISHWGDLVESFYELPAGPTEVELADPPDIVQIRMPSSDLDRARLALAVTFWLEADIGAVVPGQPAEQAGLRAGDRVLSVDGVEVQTWHALVREIKARPGERTAIEILRNGQVLTRIVTPESVEERDPLTGESTTVGQIGIWIPGYEQVNTSLTPLEAVTAGYRDTVGMTALILGFLRDLVTGGVSPRSLGSIVTIGAASGQAAEQGLDMFLRFMALFSINLAILNILPIPILDGGHLVFLAIEAVRGRALSVEQRARWSQVGFIIIMGIMILALSNDFLNILGL
jgi:regulator of sigma E protease